MTELVIGHGNGHNKPELVNFVKDSGADSVGGNEGGLLQKELNNLVRYRYLTLGKTRHMACDFVCVRKRHKRMGVMTLSTSETVQGYGPVGNPRFIVGEYYQHPIADGKYRGIFHLEVHPVAGPQALRNSDNPNHPLVRAYMDTMHAAKLALVEARRVGFIPILTGDLQLPKHVKVPWAPDTIAGNIGLRTVSTHIDWLWFPEHMKLMEWEEKRLYDHTAFIATLKER